MTTSPTVPVQPVPETVSTAMLVPEGTRDNYLQIARDRAAVNGTSVAGALGELADEFRANHASDPLGGWDALAAWAGATDPSDAVDVTAADAAKLRAFEGAKRDPRTAMAGDPDVQAAAQAALAARVADSTSAPVDPEHGVTPVTGSSVSETTPGHHEAPDTAGSTGSGV